MPIVLSWRVPSLPVGLGWDVPVFAVRGYGTGVGVSAMAAATGGVHGFPAALSSFIGRAGPVREVAGLLEEHRLVTVTGPGGVGKTRLAGQVARAVAGRLADGAWLAELAPARDGAQVPAVAAAALGVREQPGVPVAEVLARVLARRQLLLVLDNCEHVIGAAARLCAGLLAACDDVRVLATSREPLAVAGEARYRLGPLTLPGDDAPAGGGGSEAVALFTDRARRADPRFTLSGGTGPVVARLVARLDGMPLAIELAAARVESLGAAQLLDRLDDRFALLAGGDRLAPGRHRSLAAAVEWSYQLLREHERRVFRAVSVFPGPFTLEAAETVAGTGTGPVVLHLVECSLLVPPRTGTDGRSRYAMLETLRAYGVELLAESGERDQAAAALVQYALGVAEEAAAGLQTAAGEVAAAQWLDAEDATMRQALAWAMERDLSAALRLAVALAPSWFLRGRRPGQHLLLQEVVRRAEPGTDGWCAVRLWLGMMARFSNDMAGALGHFTAVRDAVQDRGRSRLLADALIGQSSVLREIGRINEAVTDASSALNLAREIGYPAAEVLALADLSQAAMIADDPGAGVRLARQAEQIKADIPGWVSRVCSVNLTSVLTVAGDLAAAEAVCAAWLDRSRAAGNLESLTRLLIRMAFLELQAGRTEHAVAHLREALHIVVPVGGWFELINGLDCCGYLCAATGRRQEAVTVWAAHAALCRSEGAADWPADARLRQQPLREARRVLGPDRARVAEERGAAMSLATAAEYALMLTDPDGLRPPTAAAGPGGLSARERELVTLVAQGCTDAQIAVQLYISVRTVRSHLDRIRDKTGCRRRADLTRLALSAGLV
jgi:predicted ATPase/DNA-binding CsgD family transcriptional regulator